MFSDPVPMMRSSFPAACLLVTFLLSHGATALQATAQNPVTIDMSSCSAPDYPPASLRAGQQGEVLLAMLIDGDGKVRDAKVARSGMYWRLDKATLHAT